MNVLKIDWSLFKEPLSWSLINKRLKRVGLAVTWTPLEKIIYCSGFAWQGIYHYTAIQHNNKSIDDLFNNPVHSFLF